MDDNSIMPYGKYQGKKLATVPASYWIWMYDNEKLSLSLKKYAEDNMDCFIKETTKND